VARVEADLGSGDEAAVVTFMQEEVERLFQPLAGFGPTVRESIDAYRAALDPRRGTVYRQRQVFEDSVTRLTDTISSYLHLEAQAAQARGKGKNALEDRSSNHRQSSSRLVPAPWSYDRGTGPVDGGGAHHLACA
jgi:hypothetical protein